MINNDIQITILWMHIKDTVIVDDKIFQRSSTGSTELEKKYIKQDTKHIKIPDIVSAPGKGSLVISIRLKSVIIKCLRH